MYLDSLSNAGSGNSANTTSLQRHDNIEMIKKLLPNWLCLLGVFLRNLLTPPKNEIQYWKPHHIKDIRETIVDRSRALLTIVRKNCTTNEAEVLDTDTDQII